MNSVGFTGRPPNRLGGYGRSSNPYYEWVVEQIGDVLGRTYQKGCRRFISGMALGFDFWVAEEVLAWQNDRATSDVILVAAVAFPSQPSKWNSSDQDKFDDMLRQAEVHTIGGDPYSNGKLFERNRWIVDNSDVLVAGWDERPDGGTWNTVSYARKQGKMIYVINYERKVCKWMK